ncbi:MAG: arylesterase [Bacteroidia bacterium]
MKNIFFAALILTVFSVACNTNSKENKSQKMVVETEDLGEKKVEEKKKIIFFGNSITAGYQLAPESAFPNLIQMKLDSLGLNYECVNAGVSGETTTGGLQRVDWVTKGAVDVFVLELGANDGLRGLPLEETHSNLVSIIKRVQSANPNVKVLLCGMEVPPNMGDEYAREFREIFINVSNETDVPLLNFLLEKVAGKKELNLSDGIHPTEEGHKLVAQTVWKALEPLLD